MPQAATYTEAVEEVKQQISQLRYLCACWRESEMSHDRFMLGVLVAQREFQGIPARIWDHSETTGRQLVEEHNQATAQVLKVYEAISSLRKKGFRDTAPVAEKQLVWSSSTGTSDLEHYQP